MVPAKRILNIFCILSLLNVWSNVMVGADSPCVSRRCLANDLIAKGLYSPPQPPTCAVIVNLTSIQYETLSVDTKTLRFSSRIKIEMEWTDPDLAWSNQQYEFTELMLPVDKIWTPDLTVDNAVETEVKPVSTDILVSQDGTVQHSIQLYTTVVCGINLFNYPFVTDACPVALNGWSQSSCGLRFQYGNISTVGTSRGEWQTLSVELHGNTNRLDRNYLYVRTIKRRTQCHESLPFNLPSGLLLYQRRKSCVPKDCVQYRAKCMKFVTMSINPFNTIVTLILPTVLIMVADLVSFALPLEGGKRSSFKITLVLSFTMSLLILTDSLPDTGLCSPLIRYHFCFCLVVLVVSLLASMIFTRLAVDGSLFSCPLLKRRESDKLEATNDTKQDISLNGVDTVCADVSTEEASVQKVVTFLENMEKANNGSKKRQLFANRFDKVCFWIYFCMDVIYIICLIAITRTEFCKINNLDFWSS